jgi:hypothetical protein
MKIVFYGRPHASCAAPADGGGTIAPDAQAAHAPPALAWTPDPASDDCRRAGRFAKERPLVAIDTAARPPVVGLVTTTGPDAEGRPAVFGPWGSGGQDGRGTNAGIEGTFVIFRQDWSGSTAHHPWAGRPARAARLRSIQSVSDASVGSGPQTAAAVQVKQQIVVTVMNTACRRAPGHACQFQYLLNTAIYRAGVSDWAPIPWFANANVMFDPAQGGIPVIEAPVKEAGVDTADGRSRLSLFTSQGEATQHADFANKVFDVRVSFEQLQNALRAMQSKALGVPVDRIGPRELAQLWGPAFDDPAAWVLLSADVAQEAHNPDPSRHASISGSFVDLYVGPQE